MTARIDYSKVVPDGVEKLRELEHYLNAESGLERALLELVRLRVSLMNGCEHCIQLHTGELKKLHEPEERIASVSEWRDSNAYTHRERVALGWAEALTDVQDGHAPAPVYEQMREHFDEAEAAKLTLGIATINAWNRLQIGLGSPQETECPPIQ